jgi:hypothetical protein
LQRYLNLRLQLQLRSHGHRRRHRSAPETFCDDIIARSILVCCRAYGMCCLSSGFGVGCVGSSIHGKYLTHHATTTQ